MAEEEILMRKTLTRNTSVLHRSIQLHLLSALGPFLFLQPLCLRSPGRPVGSDLI